MNKKQSGFTLIELMIVIAIIGILAAVAGPAYQNYTTKARASEGAGLAASAKLAIETSFQATGAFPASNAAAQYTSSSGKYVDNIAISVAGVNSTITVTYKADAGATLAGTTLIMSAPPPAAGTSLIWTCGGGTIPANISPC